jgi:hypothetical protein
MRPRSPVAQSTASRTYSAVGAVSQGSRLAAITFGDGLLAGGLDDRHSGGRPGGHMETGRSDVLSRPARSRRRAAPAGAAGVAVRERRTIAIVAGWWSIEVPHGEVSAFRWQEQHDSALIEAALPPGMPRAAWPWTVSSTALTVASALVGRALICSFVSCREASSDSSGQPSWPVAHQSARSPSCRLPYR